MGQPCARLCSARSRSISYRRANKELFLRAFGGIIAPAIFEVIGGSPLLRSGQRTRGGSIISPSLFLPILDHFSIIFCGSTHLVSIPAGSFTAYIQDFDYLLYD